MNWTSSAHFWHVFEFAISVFLEPVVFLVHVVLWPMKGVNCSVMSSDVCSIWSLPNIQDQKVLTLHWCSLCWSDNKVSMERFVSKDQHHYGYEFLPWHCTLITQVAQSTKDDTIDAYFVDEGGSVSLMFLCPKTVNTSFFAIYSQSPLRSPKMECQKSLILNWHSCSQCGSHRS